MTSNSCAAYSHLQLRCTVGLLPVAFRKCHSQLVIFSCHSQLELNLIRLYLFLQQVASHPQCLLQHPALQADTPPPPPLPFLLNFQQRFSHLLGLRRACVVSTQLDSHGDLVLSASASGKVALHDFAMLRESSSSAV